MKNLTKIYRAIIQIAPLSSVVTILYFMLDAIAPAMTTVLFANMFLGISEIIAGGNTELLLKNVVAFLALRAVLNIVNYGYSVLVNTGVFEKGTMHFRIALREKATKLPLLSMETAETLDWKRQAERAVEEETLPMVFHQTLGVASAAVSTILVSVVLAGYHKALFLVAVLTVIPFLVTQVVQGKNRTKIKNEQVRDLRRADYYWSLLTQKESVKEMRVLGCQSYISDLWKNTNTKLHERLWQQEKKSAIVTTICDVVKLLGYGISVCLTLVLVFYGKIGLNVFAATVSAVSSMQNTTRNFMEMMGEVPEMLDLANNYYRFMELREEADGVLKTNGRYREISLKHISFAYPDSKVKALCNVDLEIHAGEKIAIVGENGSGKTTLSKIILGAYPADSGDILWNGVPYSQISRNSFYRYISIVPQDYVKYYLTLRENVGISQVENMDEDEKIWKVLKQGDMDVFSSLEEQLGSEYGGRELSGGQWQKMAIARGLFRDSELIVLDEPTSALDPMIETEILENFLKLSAGKTALIISHRIGICHLMDRVLVMKQGELVESGSHEELLQQNGEYARLYRAQADWYQ